MHAAPACVRCVAPGFGCAIAPKGIGVAARTVSPTRGCTCRPPSVGRRAHRRGAVGISRRLAARFATRGAPRTCKACAARRTTLGGHSRAPARGASSSCSCRRRGQRGLGTHSRPATGIGACATGCTVAPATALRGVRRTVDGGTPPVTGRRKGSPARGRRVAVVDLEDGGGRTEAAVVDDGTGVVTTARRLATRRRVARYRVPRRVNGGEATICCSTIRVCATRLSRRKGDPTRSACPGVHAVGPRAICGSATGTPYVGAISVTGCLDRTTCLGGRPIGKVAAPCGCRAA